MKYNLITIISVLLLLSCSGKNDSSNAAISCIEDLNGHTLAVETGSLQDITYSQYKQIDLMRLGSMAELIQAVKSGKAEFYSLDSASSIGMDLKKEGIKWMFSDYNTGGEVAVAFHKDADNLCDKFNEYLAGIESDAINEDMQHRWLNCNADTVSMPDFASLPSPAAGEPSLIVGMAPYYPFNFVREDKVVGYEAELVYRFGEYLGRPVSIQLLEFSALIPGLVTKKIDMICSLISVTDERKKSVLFSDPYYRTYSAFFCKDSYDGDSGKTTAFFDLDRLQQRFYNNIIKEKRWQMLLNGLWETVVIAFWSIIIGTIFGALLCRMRMCRNRWLVSSVRLFVDFIRGVPLLVFLMLLFYVVFVSMPITARWVAIIAFAINFGAYTSEIFRTGIQSIARGQKEAGLALGFSPLATFFTIILPQAMKRIVPVYKGEVVSLIKNTSLVGYIAILDLTKASDIIRSRTFDAFFPLIIVSIIYLLLAWLAGKLLDRLAK